MNGTPTLTRVWKGRHILQRELALIVNGLAYVGVPASQLQVFKVDSVSGSHLQEGAIAQGANFNLLAHRRSHDKISGNYECAG